MTGHDSIEQHDRHGPYRGVGTVRVKKATLEYVRAALHDMEGEPPDGSDLSTLVNLCRRLLAEAADG